MLDNQGKDTATGFKNLNVVFAVLNILPMLQNIEVLVWKSHAKINITNRLGL